MVEIPTRVKRDLKFIFVDRMDEVLPVALLPEAASDPSRQPSTTQPN
jgi:ATP-dependent Lon protease